MLTGSVINNNFLVTLATVAQDIVNCTHDLAS